MVESSVTGSISGFRASGKLRKEASVGLERLPRRIVTPNAMNVSAVLRLHSHKRQNIVHDVKDMQALERSVRRLLEIALPRAPEAFIFFLWSH
jgi:hypothetical protein